MINKTCTQTGCQKPFEITADDEQFYAKMGVPAPTLCPDCRQQRRLTFRNERHLYHRSCDLCQKTIISIHHADAHFPVYCPDCWWSDRWDAQSFGRDFDFSRPFFEQFAELKRVVPQLSLHVTSNENSQYVNLTGYCKNCHLIFASEYNTDCIYGTQVIKSDHCLDTLNCLESQYCGEVVDVQGCYELFYAQSCKNCSSSYFLSDCSGCTDCLFCVGLRNQKYCIFNQQYTQEQFLEQKAAFLQHLHSGQLPQLQTQFNEFRKSAPQKALEMQSCENSFGDFLSNCSNARFCFDVAYGEDCHFVYTAYGVKNEFDVCHTTDAELVYESTSIGYKSYNILFSNGAWTSNDSNYAWTLQSCTQTFGCIGLRNAKYCILNKQYSKAEYAELVPKIIAHMQTTGEWGEFFPIELSPFAYNETVAQDYFPLSREEVEARGWLWKEPEAGSAYLGPKFEIPDDIAEVTDEITSKILTCEVTGKNYKIIPQELAFYKKMQLPIPRRCPDQRHRDRLALRNPRQLFSRACADCSVEIQTTFAPDRPERVLCETCYTKTVY